MSKIKILSQKVVQRIAAGEVVERPVSVVKELVENSLDAGAGSILVELLKGGRELIRVSDDGEGMLKDDLRICWRRHSTSKIQDEEDISTTVGFQPTVVEREAANGY